MRSILGGELFPLLPAVIIRSLRGCGYGPSESQKFCFNAALPIPAAITKLVKMVDEQKRGTGMSSH